MWRKDGQYHRFIDSGGFCSAAFNLHINIAVAGYRQHFILVCGSVEIHFPERFCPAAFHCPQICGAGAVKDLAPFHREVCRFVQNLSAFHHIGVCFGFCRSAAVVFSTGNPVYTECHRRQRSGAPRGKRLSGGSRG